MLTITGLASGPHELGPLSTQCLLLFLLMHMHITFSAHTIHAPWSGLPRLALVLSHYSHTIYTLIQFAGAQAPIQDTPHFITGP